MRYLRTTLYDLIASVQLTCPDYDDAQLVALIQHLLLQTRATFVSPIEISHLRHNMFAANTREFSAKNLTLRTSEANLQ